MSTMSQIKERLLIELSKNRYMEAFIQSHSDHKNTAVYSQSAQSHLVIHLASEAQYKRIVSQYF